MSNDLKQETHGDQSPNINTGGGDSNIKYVNKTVNKYTTKLSVLVVAFIGIALAFGLALIVKDHFDKKRSEEMVAEITGSTGVSDINRDEVKAEILELYDVIRKLLAESVEIKGSDLKEVSLLWEKDEIHKAEDQLRSFYENDGEQDASLEFILGSMRLMNLDYEGARDYYAKATTHDPGKHPYWNELGLVYLKLAEFESTTANNENTSDYKALALESHNKALELRKERLDTTPDDADVEREVADSYDHLGWTSYLMHQYRNALDFYEKSTLLRESINEDQANEVTGLALARSYNGRGNAKAGDAEHLEAIRDYQKALDALEPYFPERREQNQPVEKLRAQIHMNIGVANWYVAGCSYLKKASDELEEALGLHRIWVHNIVRDPPSYDHPEVAWTHFNLGLVYFDYGDAEKAKEQFVESKDMFTRLPGENTNLLEDIDNMIGGLEEAQGDDENTGCE